MPAITKGTSYAEVLRSFTWEMAGEKTIAMSITLMDNGSSKNITEAKVYPGPNKPGIDINNNIATKVFNTVIRESKAHNGASLYRGWAGDLNGEYRRMLTLPASSFDSRRRSFTNDFENIISAFLEKVIAMKHSYKDDPGETIVSVENAQFVQDCLKSLQNSIMNVGVNHNSRLSYTSWASGSKSSVVIWNDNKYDSKQGVMPDETEQSLPYLKAAAVVIYSGRTYIIAFSKISWRGSLIELGKGSTSFDLKKGTGVSGLSLQFNSSDIDRAAWNGDFTVPYSATQFFADGKRKQRTFRNAGIRIPSGQYIVSYIDNLDSLIKDKNGHSLKDYIDQKKVRTTRTAGEAMSKGFFNHGEPAHNQI